MELTDLVSAVGFRLEIPLILGPALDRDHAFSVRIVGFEYPSGFALSVTQTPLSWRSALVFDTLGGQWAAEMQSFYETYPKLSGVTLKEAESLVGSLDFVVNHLNYGQTRPLPTLKAHTKYQPDQDPSVYLSRHLIGVFFVLRTFLYRDEIPLEQEGETKVGEVEGTAYIGARNRYERSRANRAMAIEIHGASCKACGLDVGDFYGVDGAAIIHIHHLTPLSNLETEVVVNPRTDLVPLCPNCHNFAHKRNPPFTIPEITAAIRNTVGKQV